MKRIFFLMIILTSLGLKAQNWAPVGAEWYYSKIPVQQAGVTFSKVEVEKDTVINGQLCSKIIGIFQCPWFGPQFTYESNDTIYFYNSELDAFQFLFDIGASPGDTWEVNFIPPSASVDTARLIVDSVGQTNINGEMLRVVHITQTNANDAYIGFYGPIIERIGAPQLLTNYFNCHPAGEVRCYLDQLISYHKDPSIPCDYSTLEVTKEELSSITIYPNPVVEQLNFISDYTTDLSFVIFDLTGKTILQGKASNSQIDVSTLENGTYLLKLMNGEMEIGTHKFLKL